jgi:hypothetical protein
VHTARTSCPPGGFAYEGNKTTVYTRFFRSNDLNNHERQRAAALFLHPKESRARARACDSKEINLLRETFTKIQSLMRRAFGRSLFDNFLILRLKSFML